MGIDQQAAENENLLFFGKVIASISHEIKNVMAIINEKAGLLEDLALMAKKGMVLDTNRVESIARDMTAQIRRGDAIIKNMNKFAHSIDADILQVNLTELTALMTTLSERSASRFGVTLSFKPVQTIISIRTRPFLLELMIWSCLQIAMETCREAKTVHIVLEKTEPGAEIKFMPVTRQPDESIPEESLSWLSDALGAHLKANIEESQLILRLPDDISDQMA